MSSTFLKERSVIVRVTILIFSLCLIAVVFKQFDAKEFNRKLLKTESFAPPAEENFAPLISTSLNDGREGIHSSYTSLVVKTLHPSLEPTLAPPTTSIPTVAPSPSFQLRTLHPSIPPIVTSDAAPTLAPSEEPVGTPTLSPIEEPIESPTAAPVENPVDLSSSTPTVFEPPHPTFEPTEEPRTFEPSEEYIKTHNPTPLATYNPTSQSVTKTHNPTPLKAPSSDAPVVEIIHVALDQRV